MLVKKLREEDKLDWKYHPSKPLFNLQTNRDAFPQLQWFSGIHRKIICEIERSVR